MDECVLYEFRKKRRDGRHGFKLRAAYPSRRQIHSRLAHAPFGPIGANDPGTVFQSFALIGPAGPPKHVRVAFEARRETRMLRAQALLENLHRPSEEVLGASVKFLVLVEKGQALQCLS